MLGEEKDKYQCHLLLSLQGHGNIAALKFAKTQTNNSSGNCRGESFCNFTEKLLLRAFD